MSRQGDSLTQKIETADDRVVSGMIACHECDALHRLMQLPEHETAHCARCNATLYRNQDKQILERSLALHLAALLLYVMANAFPFLSLKFGGRTETDVLISGPMTLFDFGMGDIGTVVLLTSIVFPLLSILASLYLLIPLHYGYEPARAGPVFRLVSYIRPWSLLGVFMLAVLIAIVKLLDLADVEVGISLLAFAVMLPVLLIGQQSFDSSLIWPHDFIEDGGSGESGDGDAPLPSGSAKSHAMLQCHCCLLLVQQMQGQEHEQCPRCAAGLHMRKANSLVRCWALLIAAAILLIPANFLPVLTVIQFGIGDPSTILGGIVHLIEEGMWVLGLIVLFASIMVPVSKLVSLVYLLLSVRQKSNWRPEDRTVLYRITEAIGSWSMVDIFIIGILASLVSMDALATIEPREAASYFGAAVVVTMFAAQSFDPRLIWDAIEEDNEGLPESVESRQDAVAEEGGIGVG